MYDDSFKETSHKLDVLGVQHALLRVIDNMPYSEFNLRAYDLLSYQVMREEILNFVSWLLLNRVVQNEKYYEDGRFRQYWTDKRVSNRVCAETDAQILLSFVKELDDCGVPLDYFILFSWSWKNKNNIQIYFYFISV